MKKGLIVIFSFVALVLAMGGCKNVIGSGMSFSDADTVAIEKVSKCDTSWFALTTGGRCDVDANVAICYPSYYKDAESTKQLKHLYVANVLEIGDTIKFEDSFAQYVKSILEQYGISQDEEADHVEDDYVCVYHYSNTTNIDVAFNRNDIITFCRAEIIKKNGEITMSTHRYYNFDLKNMSRIDINSLFSESVLNNVAQLLKAKLMKQNNVDNEDSLIDLGYFNLDNLRVTNNFYFTDNSVVWNYVPYEISLYSVGETEIELTYDELSIYLNENSPVSYVY